MQLVHSHKLRPEALRESAQSLATYASVALSQSPVDHARLGRGCRHIDWIPSRHAREGHHGLFDSGRPSTDGRRTVVLQSRPLSHHSVRSREPEGTHL